MINLQNVKVKNGSTWNTICPFPVGFVYSSYTNTSPGSTFGGTWTPITGSFPYYNNGVGTGGKNSVTLSIDNLPAHTHQVQCEDLNSAAGSVFIPLYGGRSASRGRSATTSTGGGQSFSIMPAYQTLYAWRRTA